MVHCLRLRAPTVGGTGSIPGQGTKIPHAAWRGQSQNKNKNKIGNGQYVMGTNPSELRTGLGARAGAWRTFAVCLVLIFCCWTIEKSEFQGGVQDG